MNIMDSITEHDSRMYKLNNGHLDGKINSLDYLEKTTASREQLRDEIIEEVKGCIPFDNPPLCNEAVLDEIKQNLDKLKEGE